MNPPRRGPKATRMWRDGRGTLGPFNLIRGRLAKQVRFAVDTGVAITVVRIVLV